MALYLDTRHANIYAERGALPIQPQRGKALTLRIVPVENTYEATQLAVRYGKDPYAEQTINGEQQWEEQTLTPNARGIVTLPAEVMNGKVRVIAHYKATKESKYLPVFSDEFEGKDHSEPNTKVWSRTPRRGSTWSRFCSNDTAVVYLRDGELVCRAMATPQRLKGTEPKDFISGGIKSEGKFSFQYGRAEARLFTKPHSGNFPAFWMMPQDGSAGWPKAGEIDIWVADQHGECVVPHPTLSLDLHAQAQAESHVCRARSQHRLQPLPHFRRGVDAHAHFLVRRWRTRGKRAQEH